jgi:tRNA(adenine34) deaminase
MNYALFMGEALAEGRLAAARGAPAVGAVAVLNDAMVARGTCALGEGADPTAHAVITVLREAARKLGTTRLSDLTIFTTLEPCPMCVGALLACDAAALVYAAPNPVAGAAGTVIQLAQHPALGRGLEVVSGICRSEAEDLVAAHEGAAAGA